MKDLSFLISLFLFHFMILSWKEGTFCLYLKKKKTWEIIVPVWKMCYSCVLYIHHEAGLIFNAFALGPYSKYINFLQEDKNNCYVLFAGESTLEDSAVIYFLRSFLPLGLPLGRKHYDYVKWNLELFIGGKTTITLKYILWRKSNGELDEIKVKRNVLQLFSILDSPYDNHFIDRLQVLQHGSLPPLFFLFIDCRCAWF